MKILLATDGSEWSEGAAKFTTRFDFTHADEIIVLHVAPGGASEKGRETADSALTRLGEEIAPGIVDAMARYLKTFGPSFPRQ